MIIFKLAAMTFIGMVAAFGVATWLLLVQSHLPF